MREPVEQLARKALADLGKRYNVTPNGPVLIEMFPRHDDFAVRTLGLPGMVGALGACFGRVVTLDSPRARPPGTFNWAATLWHELAHVVTLQLSNQRVPRWLTEGASVFEERRADASWGREGEIDFLRAYAAGKAIQLAVAQRRLHRAAAPSASRITSRRCSSSTSSSGSATPGCRSCWPATAAARRRTRRSRARSASTSPTCRRRSTRSSTAASRARRRRWRRSRRRAAGDRQRRPEGGRHAGRHRRRARRPVPICSSRRPRA